MTAASVMLVVIAAVVHATWNFMVKRSAEAGPAFLAVTNLIICLAYAPWALWRMAREAVVWTWPVFGCLAVSAAINLAYTLTLQRGYRVAALSVVYPVARGTGPLLAALAAVLLLGETPTLFTLLGLLAVVAGILLISTDGRWRDFAGPGGRAGFGWGVATGALIAAYSVVDAWGVKALGIAPVMLVWVGNALRLPMLAPVILANPAAARARMRGHWAMALGVGLLSPLSYILVLAALDSGAPLGVVAPMREMSMMVAALLGVLLLKERVGPARLAGCAAMIGGVVLLGLA
ncbi:MAG: EamA family transporter [Caulobacter sp.]|nr:EamA family transporter [Caulobacter sp.]